MERLTRQNKTEVVEVLAQSFHDYPVMRFVLQSVEAEYEKQLRDLVAFFCEARFAKEGHVMGIREGKDLIAVTLMDEAVQKPWPALNDELSDLREKIGNEAYIRLEKYERISSAAEPESPHYFVGMIGVLQHKQGRGYARALLEFARAVSAQDANSAGVCLSTESETNVSFYQHFGYKVVGETDIEDLHSWCMFLPTR